ncbi:hypothetical protein AVANS_1001 [Campylobacter sp. RM5004]|uniref:hypothetical protein n=1 Tax=Campylobacter sp. RM5004 TaxID=1660078 RepID=UPI001EFADB15|nr:hypothetical protein [Campylobacter sp. RM5004]ULO01627.1 hypothetical protein AVANS_1001 [Campylobacter sp. RM5004]
MYSKLIEFIRKSLYYLFVLLFALIILMIGIVSMAIYNFFQPYDHSDFVKVTKELKKVEEILLKQGYKPYYDFGDSRTYKVNYNELGYGCIIDELQKQKYAIQNFFVRYLQTHLEKINNYKSIDEIKEIKKFSKDLLKTSQIYEFNYELTIDGFEHFYDKNSFIFKDGKLFVKYYYFDFNNNLLEENYEFLIDDCGYIERM